MNKSFPRIDELRGRGLLSHRFALGMLLLPVFLLHGFLTRGRRSCPALTAVGRIAGSARGADHQISLRRLSPRFLSPLRSSCTLVELSTHGAAGSESSQRVKRCLACLREIAQPSGHPWEADASSSRAQFHTPQLHALWSSERSGWRMLQNVE